MATVPQLAAAEYQEIGYVLFIEGWSVAFTNRVELAGSGESSWIGVDEGPRTVALGLEVPQSIRYGIGIVESGMLVEDSASFRLIDRDAHIIQYNADESGVSLHERLSPLDKPAPDKLIGYYGEDVYLWNKWVNGEAIGPAGERRQFQILPGGDMPGYDHASVDIIEGLSMLRSSTVTTAARHLEGRLCALYIIRRDPATGAWASWADQFASRASLIWWGTTRGMSAQGHEWTLECDGPSSLLRKTLNVTSPTAPDWFYFAPLTELAPGEDKIAVSFYYRDAIGSPPVRCGHSPFTDDDVITVEPDPKTTAHHISVRLQTLAGEMGYEATFGLYSGKASFTNGEARISVANNNGGSALGGVLALRMHTKLWSHLNWDPALQRRTGELGSLYELHAEGGSAFKVPDQEDVNDPAPGPFWTVYFDTLPVNAGLWADNPLLVDGDGNTRLYLPLYPHEKHGWVGLLYPEAGQTLDMGYASPFWLGQLAFPPAAKTLASGAADRCGVIAIRGKYKAELEGEEETRYQLARVHWHDYGNTVAAHPDGRTIVWLDHYFDPKAFGAKNDKIDGVWASFDFAWTSAALFGYNLNEPDRAHAVLLRLLLSTGTATWTGLGDDASPTPGDNKHNGGGPGNDREIADLSLGIPVDLVDHASFVAAAEALPSGIGDPLNKTRVLAIGPVDSQELIEQLIKPRGWCFSLRGGKYGLFARNAALDLEAVEVAIGPGDIAGEPDEVPPSETVDFRPLEPLDLVEVSYGHNQFEGGGGGKTLRVKARDPRAHMRHGNAKVDFDGRTLLADGSWTGSFSTLWGDTLARYYAEPHALVRVKVRGHKARDLWPGTIVSYTSPWPATRNGVYGMTQRIGRVVSVERDLATLAATVEILVEGKDPTTPRRFAPIARLIDGHATVEARHDVGSRTLKCYADAWGRGGDVSDVAGFVEPAWSRVGGNAVASVWMSWDGVTWESVATFEVESVDAENHTITYVDGSLTNEIWETRYGIIVLAPYDAQNANEWPRAVFGVLCDTDGKFGAGNLDGFPWVD